MIFDLDSEIRYEDGRMAGHLNKIGLGADNQVKDVVLATSNLIARFVIVPADLLYEGEGGTVYIRATEDEVSQMPDYFEGDIPVIADGWEMSSGASAMGEVFPLTTYESMVPRMEVSNLGNGAVSISQGTEIWCMDDRWGVVDEVTLDDEGNVTTFIGLPDDFKEVRRVIPIELVLEAETNRIVLNCSAPDLPTYSVEVPGETSLAQETNLEDS